MKLLKDSGANVYVSLSFLLHLQPTYMCTYDRNTLAYKIYSFHCRVVIVASLKPVGSFCM